MDTVARAGKAGVMLTIPAREALRGHEWAIVTRDVPRHVYDLYPTKDIARRICADLNKRYGNAYEVAAIDFYGVSDE